MANTWRSKVQYQKLSTVLAGTEGVQFERALLPFLRLVYPNVIQAQSQASLDKAGIDLAVPGTEEGTFKLGIQCKGFRITDAEVASSQVRQCIGSIKSFASHSVQIEEYWLVHNRIGRLEKFRPPVLEALATLRQTGRVGQTRLLNRDEFLDEIMNLLYPRFRQFVFDRAKRSAEGASGLGMAEAPLKSVPFTIQHVRISKAAFTAIAAVESRVGDPLVDLSEGDADSESHMKLVMGEFGMGKTTLAFRMASRERFSVLYVPAAAFPPKISGTRELVTYFCGAADFVAEFEEDQGTILDRVTRIMSHKLLSEVDNRLILVIDGLDESPFLTSGNGFSLLFDTLSGLRARAVLTMRTEYWRTRSESLLAGYGGRSAPTKVSVRNRFLSMLELQAWSNEQILSFMAEMQNTVTEESGRQHLRELVETIRADSYYTLYGDIPRRPLFLRILCEFVAEYGVGETSLAQLFREWVAMKLRRDYLAPLAHGGRGRDGIRTSEEVLDVRRRIAIATMKEAAILMTSETANEVQLLPYCDFIQLTERVPSLRGEADLAGLALNSLLLPEQRHGDVSPVRFAHQAFQEYFLARAIMEDSALTQKQLPLEVKMWCRRLQSERANLNK